jgi:hypothetical protein
MGETSSTGASRAASFAASIDASEAAASGWEACGEALLEPHPSSHAQPQASEGRHREIMLTL